MNHNSVFSNLSDKDKVDFYIALAVVFLTGVFILYFIFPSHPTNINDNNILIDNSQEIDQLHIEDNIYVPVTNDILKRNKIKPVKKIRSTPMPESISSTKNAAIIDNEKLDPLSTKEETTNVTEETSTILKDIKDTLNIPSVTENKPKTIVSEIVKTKIITEAPIIKEAKEVIKTKNDETSCIVVIGAYGKQSSIDKLVRKLEKNNYKIFKTPYKSLTRIGVYLPCDKVTIERELIKLRRNYAKDAMLLRKDEK